MPFLPAIALLLGTQTGTLKAHVTIGPLPRAERRKYHTHWDKSESVGGFEVHIYGIVRGKESANPVSDFALKDSGDFALKLAPGPYVLTMSRDMHAGAYTIYPTKRFTITPGHTVHLRLHLRSEYIG
jgi:hypothetical protein